MFLANTRIASSNPPFCDEMTDCEANNHARHFVSGNPLVPAFDFAAPLPPPPDDDAEDVDDVTSGVRNGYERGSLINISTEDSSIGYEAMISLDAFAILITSCESNSFCAVGIVDALEVEEDNVSYSCDNNTGVKNFSVNDSTASVN